MTCLLVDLWFHTDTREKCCHGGNSPGHPAMSGAGVRAFVSPSMQRAGAQPVISAHSQPAAAAAGIVAKVKQLPRRTGSHQHAFDGSGTLVVDSVNDVTPVSLVTGPPTPTPGEIFLYDDMITRVANEYDTRFASI
jgi:hypothetical protein